MDKTASSYWNIFPIQTGILNVKENDLTADVMPKCECLQWYNKIFILNQKSSNNETVEALFTKRAFSEKKKKKNHTNLLWFCCWFFYSSMLTCIVVFCWKQKYYNLTVVLRVSSNNNNPATANSLAPGIFG